VTPECKCNRIPHEHITIGDTLSPHDNDDDTDDDDDERDDKRHDDASRSGEHCQQQQHSRWHNGDDILLELRVHIHPAAAVPVARIRRKALERRELRPHGLPHGTLRHDELRARRHELGPHDHDDLAMVRNSVILDPIPGILSWVESDGAVGMPHSMAVVGHEAIEEATASAAVGRAAAMDGAPTTTAAYVAVREDVGTSWTVAHSRTDGSTNGSTNAVLHSILIQLHHTIYNTIQCDYVQYNNLGIIECVG